MSDKNANMLSSACPLCFVNCGIKIETGGEDGREIIKVRGDDEHPLSKGYICNKASRLNYFQNNEARLTAPMRRKADGSYEEIDWDTAIKEIAEKFAAVRDTHGGERIFYYGGGGQGNHLGGAYAMGTRAALGIKYKSNAIAQEKTGWIWAFCRMIGATIHAEVEHAQVAMFVGKNPFMSNGMDRARNVLREMKKDPARKLIVMDPRRSETTDYADIHLAVKPGRDAWALAAILAHITQQNNLPMDWLAAHTNGYDEVIKHIQEIDVDAYAEFAGLAPALVRETADLIAGAQSFALEEDIGIQMAPHSTLVSYLNLLVQLMTGNFGREGTMGLPVQLVSVLSADRAKLDDKGYEIERRSLPITGAPIVSGLAPCNSIADEILNDDERRLRAIFIESANPVHSLAESDKMRRAIRSLEVSVAIDVAFTETARECDYILPASSQFEKWEATTFPRSYPANYFHLRPPIFEPAPNTLGEPEIHARLVEALNGIDASDLAPLHEAATKNMAAYRDTLIECMMSNPKIKNMISYALYRTLPPLLPEGAAATAAFFGLAQIFTLQYPNEAARAGFSGPDGGNDLFNTLISSPSGAIIGEATHEDSFQRIPFKDKKLRLVIREMLDELDTLSALEPLVSTSDEFPFALAAGERRAYTANTNIRDPQWAKGRNLTAISIHPADAETLGLQNGAAVILETAHGQADGVIGFDDRMRPGTLSIPNGQGMDYPDEEGNKIRFGVYANELTSTAHCDRFVGTPLHKFVPAKIRAA